MRRHVRVPCLAAVEILQARALQLHAHVDGQRRAHDPRQNGKDQVERTDVLMVGAEQPALDEARRVRVVVRVVMPLRMGAVMSSSRHYPMLPCAAGCGSTLQLCNRRRTPLPVLIGRGAAGELGLRGF